MAIRNSITRSFIPLLSSVSVLALTFGCGSEATTPGMGESPLATDTATNTVTPPVTPPPVTPSATTGAVPPVTPPSVTPPPANPPPVTPPVTPTPPATTGEPTTTTTATPTTSATSEDTMVSEDTGATSGGEDTAEPPPPSGGEYNPDFKEFVGEDCDVPEPMDVDEETLNDLFLKADGQRWDTKADWNCQRAYLKAVVEKYIHGAKPPKPDMVTGTVAANQIAVNISHGGKTANFTVSVSIPANAPKPAPAVIGLGGGAGSLRASILSELGIATINFNNTTIANESSGDGVFKTIYGDTGASAQVGWAWGVSRIIDVLVDEKAAGKNDLIDPTALAVTGCSRLGKGAFTIGAFDERIALGIPHESGTGGVSALRIVNTNPQGPNGKGAETIQASQSAGPRWFGNDFKNTYDTKVNTIPGDMHNLVAMYAPRGLLVLDNSRIGELCATCQHAASVAGAEVFKALGVEKNVAYHGGNPGDPHNHCSFYDSQAEPLKRALKAHLVRDAEPDGRMEPQPAGTADLAKWITWEAPAMK